MQPPPVAHLKGGSAHLDVHIVEVRHVDTAEALLREQAAQEGDMVDRNTQEALDLAKGGRGRASRAGQGVEV